MSLSALIFDVDGTMADTEEVHRRAFNGAFVDAGYDWHWDRQLYGHLLTVTGGRQRIRFYLEQHHPDMLSADNIDQLIGDLHIRKTALYVAAVKAGKVPLRPGIERLLRQARDQGLIVAIATTTTPANVQSLIENTLGRDALDWFKVIGAGDCVDNLKPAPDVYLWVLDRLDLPAASCLAIEDSANGLKAAMAAGIPTLITANPYTENDDFNGALAVLDGLGENAQDGIDLQSIRRWHREHVSI